MEMVDSVDEFKSSRSVQGFSHFPNFVLLDARIVSALNKIIQNSYVKKKVSLEEQKAQREYQFLRGRQIAYMICDYFRVTGAHDTVLDYADVFSITLRNDNVQEFDSRWDEILLCMTKIPPDNILEPLYKLRIRESDQQKTVLELYDMEIHQKISMPNYQKLKTMVKRSIDQKLRLRNFDARNERIETGAVVTSRRGSSGVERGQGVCSQWNSTGQCSRGDQCSFRHDGDERAKSTPKTAPSLVRRRHGHGAASCASGSGRSISCTLLHRAGCRQGSGSNSHKGMREGLKKEDKGVQTSFMSSASLLRRLEAKTVRERLWEYARKTGQKELLVTVTGARLGTDDLSEERSMEF